MVSPSIGNNKLFTLALRESLHDLLKYVIMIFDSHSVVETLPRRNSK